MPGILKVMTNVTNDSFVDMVVGAEALEAVQVPEGFPPAIPSHVHVTEPPGVGKLGLLGSTIPE